MYFKIAVIKSKTDITVCFAFFLAFFGKNIGIIWMVYYDGICYNLTDTI